MRVLHSLDATLLFSVIPVMGMGFFLSSCGSGGGGGGSRRSGNPTNRAGGADEPLLLDIEQMLPGGDTVALANSLYSKKAGDTYSYDIPVPAPGRYQVHLWWTSSSTRSRSVPVTIEHEDGKSQVTVDQTSSGGQSLYAKDSGTYTFQRSLSSPGTFDVYAWWTEWSTRNPAVPYDIFHAQGVATVTEDQRMNGGKWNLLGRYAFGNEVKVTVKASGAATVCADAVRFVPAGTLPPPPDDTGVGSNDIVVDEEDPGTTSDGVWLPSSGINPFGGASLYALR